MLASLALRTAAPLSDKGGEDDWVLVQEMALVGRDGDTKEKRSAVYLADNSLKQRVFRC